MHNRRRRRWLELTIRFSASANWKREYMILELSGIARYVSALLCLLSLAVGVCAGRQAPPPYESHSVIFADTEEVSLDLVARDKKGHLVKDLKPADLKILDAGSQVAISDLRLVTPASDSDHL